MKITNVMVLYSNIRGKYEYYYVTTENVLDVYIFVIFKSCPRTIPWKLRLSQLSIPVASIVLLFFVAVQQSVVNITSYFDRKCNRALGHGHWKSEAIEPLFIL